MDERRKERRLLKISMSLDLRDQLINDLKHVFIFDLLFFFFFLYRELREKEEIEKYRMERPKIQQQFSDLKVQ